MRPGTRVGVPPHGRYVSRKGSEMRFAMAVLLPSLALLSASPVGAAGFDAHRLWTVQGDAGSHFGSAVVAGDVNGDGFRDVIVGASNAITSAGSPDGKAFAYYGGPGGLPDTPSWSAEGEHGINPSSLFGATLVTADVNRDGFDDLVVGSWAFQVFADHDNGAGRLYAYYGSAQGLPAAPSFVADGIDYDRGYVTGIGYTLDTGDFNGDGFPDIAASNYSKYTGGVFVYFGSLSGLSLENSWSIVGGGFPLIDFGATASVGDFDGDGFDDLILTTQSQFFPIEPDMVAFVYRGSPTGFPPVSGPGDLPPAAFTFTNWTTAASVGDVDGDGFDDILALELDDGGCLCNAPNYVLFRGSPSGPVRAQELPPSIDDLYPVLHRIGDLNGDGFADLIAVEQQLYLVHFGSASGLDPLSNGMGKVPAGPFVAAGDFNGDGTGDLLVGDGSNDRADLYRGGTDWSFTSTADLAVEQIAFEGGNPEAIFDMTVTNRGPDAVRLRLFDPIPPTMAGG